MKLFTIGSVVTTLVLFAAAVPVSIAQTQHRGAGHGAMHGKEQMKGHMSGHRSVAGQPGDAAKVDRTIELTMYDNYFEPEEIAVKAGETIRFAIRNKGQFLHEFSLGTAANHAAHQQQMAMMMEHGMITPTGIDHKMMKMDHGGKSMMHDDGSSALVEPGKSAELIWTFAEATELEFACNMPGHYDAGMAGRVRFRHGDDG
tara:strand:- start:420 stop:1022 length:603 start_codon:yes stop_codon:yes gene_type:complete